jgi:hypothetical protein
MIYVVLIGYILPMLVNAIYIYKDETVETIGDFLEYSWMVIIPIMNFFLMCLIPLTYIIDLLENRFDIKFMWKNLMNKKIKKEKGL